MERINLDMLKVWQAYDDAYCAAEAEYRSAIRPAQEVFERITSQAKVTLHAAIAAARETRDKAIAASREQSDGNQ